MNVDFLSRSKTEWCILINNYCDYISGEEYENILKEKITAEKLLSPVAVAMYNIVDILSYL